MLEANGCAKGAAHAERLTRLERNNNGHGPVGGMPSPRTWLILSGVGLGGGALATALNRILDIVMGTKTLP